MEKLMVLGTGNAMATRCFNTCFALQNDEGTLLVDAGGGNGILGQLKRAGLAAGDIGQMFLTHAHCDHLLGAVWMVRLIGTEILAGRYTPPFSIYCTGRMIRELHTLCEITLEGRILRLMGNEIRLIPVEDGGRKEILGCSFHVFSIHSTKAEQHGFAVTLGSGRKLCFLGDEPYHPSCEGYATGCDWLLSEAFCLYEDRERFKPYDKHHSTALDAANLAERLGAKNLVLWHTEDHTLSDRKRRYTEECRAVFSGGVFVPDDLEVIELT